MEAAHYPEAYLQRSLDIEKRRKLTRLLLLISLLDQLTGNN